MFAEGEKLVTQIRKEFADLEGPPRITLSVARGLDDYWEERKELARLQRHHVHWMDVSKDEMEHYHDTWVFMDCEAFRFYLPAFMAAELESDKVIHNHPPAWVHSAFFKADAEQVACFTAGQKRCVREFLELICSSLSHPDDRASFREEIVVPWRGLLVG